jgi:uncharacterized RDD family membrane protein YckC
MGSGFGPAEHHQVSAVPEEARPYQGRRAGVVSRLIADTVDFLAVLVALGGIYVAVSASLFLWAPARFHFPTPSRLVAFAVAGSILFLYLTVAWATTGRTYGDHLLGLRVVSLRGNRVHLVVASARSVLCIVFPIGVMWAAASSANRSVQDVVLRTSVIYDWGHGAVEHRADASDDVA